MGGDAALLRVLRFDDTVTHVFGEGSTRLCKMIQQRPCADPIVLDQAMRRGGGVSRLDLLLDYVVHHARILRKVCHTIPHRAGVADL